VNIGALRLNLGPLSRRAAGCIDGHNFTYTTSNPDFFEFLVPLDLGRHVLMGGSPQKSITAEKYLDHCYIA